MQSKTKSMLLMILVLVIGFILGALSSGAIRHQKDERIKRMSPEQQFSEVMEKIIQPTEEQKKEIADILKKESERIAKIQQQRQKEFFAVFDSSRKALDAVLTPEQKEKLETHMQKTRKKFEEMEVERLTRVLDLTDEQVEKVRQIFAEKPEHKPGEMGPGPGGPGPGPGPEGDGPKDFDKMKEGMNSFEAKIEKILTDEQKEKYQEFKNRKREEFNKEQGMPGGGPMPRPHTEKDKF